MTNVSLSAIEPFSPQSTPQQGDLETAAFAMQAFQEQVTEYLNRFRRALLADLIGAPAYVPPIIVATMVGVDFPSIGSNSAESLDFTMPVTLGMHILSWAPVSDATSIQDLLIQILIVADNTVRVTMQNPTAGAIDPDPISLQFIVATAVDTI